MVKAEEEERRALERRVYELKEKKRERNSYNWYSLLVQFHDLQDQGIIPEDESWDTWRKKQLSQRNRAVENHKCAPDQEWVASYRKKDGTYVKGFCRQRTFKSGDEAYTSYLVALNAKAQRHT